MKTINSQNINNVSDLAVDVVNRSEVHAAYNRRGEISHFVVMVPRDEFYRLYPRDTDINVFAQGRWLQFSFGRELARLVSRYSGATLVIRFDDDQILNLVRVSYYHHGKKIYMCTINKCSKQQLVQTTFGIQKLSNVSCRALQKLENFEPQQLMLDKYHQEIPCIQVVPESEKEQEFNRDLVNLQ